MGAHAIRSWSKTLASVTLSSAESEFYAAVNTSTEILGIMSMMRDYGLTVGGEILGDASAAISIISRRGVGKVRHLDTNLLWVQEKAAREELAYRKVKGADNPADAFTKALDSTTMDRHMHSMGLRFEEGRADSAPDLAANNLTQEDFWRQDGDKLVRVHRQVRQSLYSPSSAVTVIKRGRCLDEMRITEGIGSTAANGLYVSTAGKCI